MNPTTNWAALSAQLQEKEFRDWYSGISKTLGINADPDDPAHFYDYRGFWRDMKAGKHVSPDQPGGHFPSNYKLPGNPRRYLQDGGGRVFDTMNTKYRDDGSDVPEDQLVASERSPDLPIYGPPPGSGGRRRR